MSSKKTRPLLSFYMPEYHFPCNTWKKIWQENLPFFRASDFSIAIQNWIYRTWHLLTQAGVECQLTTTLPSHGIVFVWNASNQASSLEDLSPDVFLVDIAMQEPLFPRANLHLLQNEKHAQQISNALFVPHWPQPHLQSRNPKRGTRFENVGFFGDFCNCAPELQSEDWFQILRHELGVFFDLRKCDRWHDYSDIDVVVAIRDFAGLEHLDKPATKLYNAWLAGVPFIGGADSAYACVGNPGKDYLVARSLQEVLAHLKQIKEDLPFRNSLVRHGSAASKHITQEATLLYWKKLVLETIPTLVKK